ncbi:Subtilisin-like protease SBT4.6 [Thalictrum thalictroides]|uniref:Subtilisin-like protease SBT4.6 n=1 Tax=Thalictrum thalictroides TaxID=46969 RepID=A0A7J6XD30_THATH|nr:Subtilisin-like protease SBT4.6 [Thalictrum thalictroides]
MEGITVFPSKKLKPQTTRSWDFMGFKEDVKRSPQVESDVIIGVIDTGIWPESESFSDQGFSPPPKKWKGTCKGGQNFTCNNKIIGARFYTHTKIKDHNSARDTIGHGTHVASIAAGNHVNRASFFGVAQGNARGAVPSARIAVYKTCWGESFGCEESDVLAAFDDAISDGVDIISASIGWVDTALEYHKDVTAIGAFHAMQKGVLTSQCAGNVGPGLSTVTSIAPWTLSVAASNIDRNFIVKVVLGDNTTLVGTGVNSFDMQGQKNPLIERSSGSAFPHGLYDNSSSRFPLEGKIIFETYFSIGEQELSEKAAGMIVVDDTKTSTKFLLPASLLGSKDGERVRAYIRNTENPVAEILKTETIIGDVNAPMVAAFSSRGPNSISKDILKPDITAPGVDILAAWPDEVPPTELIKRSVKYNFRSGTSMSCPHVSGAAAYVKTFHPDWSPSAIKSALMTTAFPMNATLNPDAEFAYGAGHIDPVKAINPGLVYDAMEGDYLNMLCSIGYTTKQVQTLSGHNHSCSKEFRGSPKDLNYPTMSSDVANVNFTRIVTNVGVPNSTYKATIRSPPNMRISVKPKVLSFTSLNEKKSFIMTVSTSAPKENSIISASLVWNDGVHNVRSPIVMYLQSNSTKLIS